MSLLGNFGGSRSVETGWIDYSVSDLCTVYIIGSI